MPANSKLRTPNPPLVSVEWLARRLEDTATSQGRDPALRVVDVRGQVLPPTAPPPRYLPKVADYAAGHLPGAVFVDWTRDIVDLADPVPVQVAGPSAFAAQMGRLGVGDETLVVAYDDYSHVFAGRLAWALRYYGHDEVRILEGGLHAWKAAGLPLVTEVPSPAPAVFHGGHPSPRLALRRTADEVVAAIGRGAFLLDARSAAQFEGKTSAAKRAGHIPTARNVPYPTLLQGPEGAFKSDAELRQAFASVGLDVDAPPKEVIVYCNGGVSATVPLTALQKLGVEGVALYDGSWNEWGADASRPIE